MRAGYINAEVKRFEHTVLQALRRHGAVGCFLVVAVSGGNDSVALLQALVRLQKSTKTRIQVVTVNHGLRPTAARDCEMVQALAAKLAVPCQTVALEPFSTATGLEAQARIARYQALKHVKDRVGANFIVTAHTASDQAETLLMRLGRGASLGGAAGIHALREDAVLRPMLQCTRSQVVEYVRALGLPVVEDAMNSDVQFLRVRMRTSVLPAFSEACGYDVAPRLQEFAAQAFEDDAFLQHQAMVSLTRLSLSTSAIDRPGVLALEKPIRRRVLTLFLERNGLAPNAQHVAQVDAAFDEAGAVTLSASLRLTVSLSTAKLDALEKG
jgi:tRNA(Ile)-lysidine synthase